ncbi:MAG: helix-turn-helix transcriptional regulator [Pseudoclavibacter sp.]
MANVILGVLLIAPMTLYELVKAFEAGVSLFYSASSGSIKRALDVLLAAGRIEVASVEPGARGRKVYRVTDTGRAAFRAWMLGDVAGGDIEVAALSRIHFLGQLSPGERVAVLRNIVERAEREVADFESYAVRAHAETIPEGLDDVARYQFVTLDYGIAAHRHALARFRGMLDTAEAELEG